MMDQEDDILRKINGAKQDFYQSNQKNILFKNKQKFECAASIMSNINEEEVFKNIVIIENDFLIMNYPVFKLVANPSNYERMASYIFKCTDEILLTNEIYNVRLITTGLTISAVERYKDFFKLVSSIGLKNGKGFLKKLDKIYIVDCPSFADYALNIIVPIIDNSLFAKFVLPPNKNNK
jgi:hypothetical protein